MIIFKKLVAADTKYPVSNLANCVLFDVHNDTPFNMGVSFGRDTGIDSADYFTSPHSVLTGIGPVGNAPSLNNVKWTGTIYIYTQTPLGTGSTNLSTSPAFQITMIGYPAGYQPTGTTSLSRMTATPNTVATVGGVATAVANNGNLSNTTIVEGQVNGDSAQATLLTNNGILILGDNLYPGSVQVSGVGSSIVCQGTIQSDNSAIFSNGLGQLSMLTVALTAGSLTRIAKSGPITITTTPTFFNHGLGAVPDIILLTVTGSTIVGGVFIPQYEYTSMTTTQVKLVGNTTMTIFMLAIKF